MRTYVYVCMYLMVYVYVVVVCEWVLVCVISSVSARVTYALLAMPQKTSENYFIYYYSNEHRSAELTIYKIKFITGLNK